MRPRVTPSKAINLVQLDGELGAVGLSRNEETGEVVAPESVTQKQLEDAVAAHVATAPPPDPDDELDAALAGVDLSTVADTATRDALGAVIAALRGTAGRAGAAAGRRP